MKGKIIKELHAKGIRKGIKEEEDWALVQLEHLKTHALINLLAEAKKNESTN